MTAVTRQSGPRRTSRASMAHLSSLPIARSNTFHFQSQAMGKPETADEDTLSESTPLTVRSGDDQIEDASPSNHCKTIGMCGSMAIAVNSLAGPAILQLPFTFQQAGLIPTIFSLLLVAALAASSALNMANVVSLMPHNSNFDVAVEFSDPFDFFWGRRSYVLTQILFCACAVCVNVAAMVDTAQVVDSYLGHSFGRGTYAVGVRYGEIELLQWVHDRPCDTAERLDCFPFAREEGSLLTLGYVLTAAVFLPICLMDLKENTCFQIFGWVVLMVISGQFMVSFFTDGLDWGNVSLWGESWDNLLGVVLFNFALVMAVPAWLSEKKPSVGVSTVVHASTALSTALYVGVGLLGALAIPDVHPNMLEPMVSGAYGASIRYGASFFAFFIIGLDIPLFSVLTRYNLTNSGLCSERTANILVVYLPWSAAWLFYQGTSVDELLSWGGLVFTSVIAFLLPLYLAIRVMRTPGLGPGSVDVYLGKRAKSKASRLRVTWALFWTSIVSVTLAVLGQAWDELR